MTKIVGFLCGFVIDQVSYIVLTLGTNVLTNYLSSYVDASWFWIAILYDIATHSAHVTMRNIYSRT